MHKSVRFEVAFFFFYVFYAVYPVKNEHTNEVGRQGDIKKQTKYEPQHTKRRQKLKIAAINNVYNYKTSNSAPNSTPFKSAASGAKEPRREENLQNAIPNAPADKLLSVIYRPSPKIQEMKEEFRYLLPADVLEESTVGTMRVEEFDDKRLASIKTPDGRTFILDTHFNANCSKTRSVYELTSRMPVRMMSTYNADGALDTIMVYHDDDSHNKRANCDILHFNLDESSRSPRWVKVREGQNNGYGTAEDYLMQLNLGIL